MWKILAKDALGLVILIDNSRPDPIADLEVYLKAYAGELGHMNYKTKANLALARRKTLDVERELMF